MGYRECNKRIVTDLKYQAVRAYEKRGPRQKVDIFVGWNSPLQRYVVAVAGGPDQPAAIRLMGTPGIDNKEQLIDCALEILDRINGNLIVYAEPHYGPPNNKAK